MNQAPIQNPSMPMAALAYAKRLRWHVFPTHYPIFGADGVGRCSCVGFRNCKNVGKHPMTQHGVLDASLDEAWIRSVWSDERANIAVACGKVSGFWVLDVDPAKGGDEALSDLERAHGKLPDTVEALTGGGGRHLLFTLPASVTIRNRVGFAHGLDTRSDGGYIIVAPSLHESRRRYAWEASSRPENVEIVAAPGWLLEKVLGAPDDRLRGVQPMGEADLPELALRRYRASRYLEKIHGAVSGQGGHLQTWLAAIALVRGFGLPAPLALELLSAEYNPRCEPRWSPTELEHKVLSAALDCRRPLGYLLHDDRYETLEREALQNESRADVATADIDLGFQLLSCAVIFATLEEPKYLVGGIVRRGSLALLGGYGSSMKTWLGLAMGLSVATGEPWLTRFACEKGRATILDWESGSYELRRRLHLIARGMTQSPIEAGIDCSSMPDVYMGTEAFAKRIQKLASQRDLIIIDSLRAASPGAEENDSTIRRGLDQLRTVAEHTSCSFLVLVHAKKTSQAVAKPDPREILRGSSAIFDAADNVLIATTSGKDLPLRIEQTKARHGPTVSPFGVQVSDTPLGMGIILKAAPLEERAEFSQSARFQNVCQLVEKAVRQHPGSTQRFLRENLEAKVRFETVHAAIEHLAKLGTITNIGTEKRQEWRCGHDS